VIGVDVVAVVFTWSPLTLMWFLSVSTSSASTVTLGAIRCSSSSISSLKTITHPPSFETCPAALVRVTLIRTPIPR